jgi:hypothetical protein
MLCNVSFEKSSTLTMFEGFTKIFPYPSSTRPGKLFRHNARLAKGACRVHLATEEDFVIHDFAAHRYIAIGLQDFIDFSLSLRAFNGPQECAGGLIH